MAVNRKPARTRRMDWLRHVAERSEGQWIEGELSKVKPSWILQTKAR